MDDLITSAEAARLAGVGTTAIKRWADSGALPCVKTAGGHRRFHRRDVERLMRSGAAAAEAGERSTDGVDWSPWIDALVRSSDVHVIQARLFDERARRGSWHGVADALGDLLGDLGRRWASGGLSVVEEHLASASLQRALGVVSEAIAVPPLAPRCLLAAAEGDEHTLGLSLVELCLREAGWRAEWVGGRTRASDVVDRISRGSLGMVALSAAESASDLEALQREADTVGAACRAAGVALVLGGAGAWPDAPRYGRRFHALAPFYEFAVEQRAAPPRG